MRAPLIVLFSGLALAGAIVAGCGGGGGAGAPAIPGRVPSGGNTTVQVTIVVPQKTSQGKRVPKYVSPSTKSAIVEIIGPLPSASPSPTSTISPSTAIGVSYVNFSPSNCATVTGGLSCNVSVSAQITQAGLYGIAVITVDQPQTPGCQFTIVPGATTPPSPTPTPSNGCVGTVLAVNIAEANIVPGSTSSIPITLGGIPAFLQPVELVSGRVGGGGGGTTGLTVFGPGTAQVSFQLLDADKNIIAGNGALNLALSGTTPNLSATITATPDPTGLYTLSLTPILTNNMVTPGSGQLFVQATVPNNFTSAGGQGTTGLANFSFPVQVMHSEIAVSKSGGQVDLYLDGNNATPTYTVYGSCASQVGLAFDPSSNLWVADPCNGEIVVFNQTPNGVTPIESTVFCGTPHGAASCSGTPIATDLSASYLAFDAQGDLFVSLYNGTSYQFNSYLAPSPGAAPNPLGPTGASITSPNSSINFGQIAVDNLGNAYVGSSNFSTFPYSYALTQYPVNLSGGGTALSTANVNGLAWSPDGALWYLTVPTSGTGTITKAKPSAFGTALNTVPGISTASGTQGIAVDMLGNLYVADGTTTGVTMYSAASNFMTPATIGNSVGPTYVAVFPDGLYGSNHPVGVAQPTQSPIPIGSPPVI